MKTKYIFDSVWGSCEISFLMQKFVDTYEFQRMRNMKQLGTSYYVFPSASGNRFEHSLGVGHLARLFALHLQKNDDSITDRFVDLIQIAGLTHDLGHGPFSHIFDNFTMDHDSNMKTHENRSKAILNFMIKKYKIPITSDEEKFICETYNPKGINKKNWKYQIISSLIDVDRMDYVLRDSMNTGIQVNFTKHQALKIIENSFIGDNEIKFNSKVDNDIKDFNDSRDYMWNRVYRHRVGKIIGEMIEKIFNEVENLYFLKKSVDNVQKFLTLDDSILQRIYWDPRVSISTKKLIDNIFQRNFS